jgi:hypothetical protein
MKKQNDKIDFVIPWVDGNDPEWQKDKAKYKGSPTSDSSISRYRDWDNLQYLFRGIETFTPWVNRIHFVTYGHLPKWLNTDNPKLNIVNHRDFIPNEYLPVFSCRPIELNIHRIPGLSEHFVYLNDDIFFLKPIAREYFFRNGLPCDTAALTVIQPTENTIDIPIWNMIHIINQHFSKSDLLKKNFGKWINLKYKKQLIRTLCLLPFGFIPGIYRAHGPSSYTKRVFETVWNEEPDILKQTCSHKFRETSDVTHYLFKMWQICTGEFTPRYDKCMAINLTYSPKYIEDLILKRKYPIICLNDRVEVEHFDEVKNHLQKLFDTILPEKSSFEL